MDLLNIEQKSIQNRYYILTDWHYFVEINKKYSNLRRERSHDKVEKLHILGDREAIVIVTGWFLNIHPGQMLK